MKFMKRLFKTTLNASKSEISELLVSLGQLTVADDFLKIENYPFEPSIAYQQTIFRPEEIEDIALQSFPPTLRIKNELIFLAADKKAELERFTIKHNILQVKRPTIWEWILEPFLDTEFTAEIEQRFTSFLEEYGLMANQVEALRAEVETQMLKYNFDTMLWEWCGFDASDVLRAMRTKYNQDEFEDFYKRVMKIALLPKINK